MESVIEVETTKLFNDSSVARILHLVQEATSKKAKTELLIRRLAKIYTPIVTYLAIAICFLPFFFVDDYVFRDWLYRALIFLVISCPCALVISIPLGYFGGLGAASKNGILFKGATFMDKLKEVNTMVMDKTGTVTKGVFKIKDIKILDDYQKDDFMRMLLAIESKSTHPIAKAVMEYSLQGKVPEAKDIKEIAGKGLAGTVDGKQLVVGNKKLMTQFGINTPSEIDAIVESIVLVGIDNQFAGYVTILLPEDKLAEVELLKKDASNVVAFIGDGINDAPVLAASDVGIAMGAMGSDVAIETADIIIQTDQPSKVVTGIKIAKSTQSIIWQNIYLAFAVKILVLIGGAFGLATMWQAVFAD